MLALAGCANVRERLGDWFGSKDNSIPPAPLVDFEPSVEIERVWSTSVGSGTDRHYLVLVPLVAGEMIYAAERDGRVRALNAESGRSIWDTRLKKTTITGGPGLGENLLFVGTGEGLVVAMDPNSGETRWTSQLTSEVLAPAVAANGIVVARTGDGKLFGLNARSGERLWVYERTVPVLTLRGNGPPVIARDLVVAGFDNGRLVALDLANGRLQWEASIAVPGGRTDLDRLVDMDGDPVVAGNTIYVASYQGQVAAVALDSGQIEWSREISSYAGLAVDSRNVYVTDADGSVWALDRLSGVSNWKQEALSARQLTAPTVIAGYVVVGDLEGYLHWLKGNDGAFAARTRLDNKRIIAPMVPLPDQTLLGYSTSGRLAAYRLM